MRNIDTLIHARWIIPVEPADQILEHHALAIHEGRIVELLPKQEAHATFQAAINHHLEEHILIPGLINTHTHAAMILMRGIADDLPLMDWLQNHIWPAEAKWVGAEFVRDGTELAIAEMLRGGVTCFNDMYYFPEEAGRISSQLGMRACIGLIMIDFPSAWARNADEYLHKGLEVHDQFRQHPLVITAFSPHAPYTVSDAHLEKIVMYADELEIQIHMHVHETAGEITQASEQQGRRPLQRLHDIGVVSPRLLAVHMTQLAGNEIELFAQAAGHVVHCPESNLKLASGFCPVQQLLDSGINVALGTDGAASNNDLDMLGEMRTAAILAKAVAHDASALPAMHALHLATLGGAKALGIDHTTGSLLPGKAADITAINLGDLETQPIYNPISQLVYATNRDKVTNVWVAGKHLLKDRVLTTIDDQAVLAKARQWREKLQHQA